MMIFIFFFSPSSSSLLSSLFRPFCFLFSSYEFPCKYKISTTFRLYRITEYLCELVETMSPWCKGEALLYMRTSKRTTDRPIDRANERITKRMNAWASEQKYEEKMHTHTHTIDANLFRQKFSGAHNKTYTYMRTHTRALSPSISHPHSTARAHTNVNRHAHT